MAEIKLSKVECPECKSDAWKAEYSVRVEQPCTIALLDDGTLEPDYTDIYTVLEGSEGFDSLNGEDLYACQICGASFTAIALEGRMAGRP